MTTEQFTYWLQGYFELSGATSLNEEQVKVIKEHIVLVLKKQTTGYVGVQGITQTDNKIYIRGGVLDSPPDIKFYTTTNKDTIVDVPTNLTC